MVNDKGNIDLKMDDYDNVKMNAVSQLKCYTLNVRGIHNSDKRVKLFKWFTDNNADIIFMQETYCTKKLLPYVKSNWKGEVLFAMTDSDHSRGTCIMFNKKLNVNIINHHSSQDGRLVLANVEIDSFQCTLLSVYAPNSESKRRELFSKIRKWLNRYAMFENIVVAGDINCCIRDIDRLPPTHLKDKSRNCIENVLKEKQLYDVWSFKHNSEPGYTYVDKNVGTKSRLDYIFVNGDLLHKVKDIGICKCPFAPDHLAVYVTVTKIESAKGSNYWKMNSSVLKNEDYRKEITNLVRKVEQEYVQSSPQVKWELLKVMVKETTMEYCKKRKSQTYKYRIELQQRLDYLIQVNGVSRTNEMDEIERELDEMYTNDIRGAQIRSKVKWTEEGEKCTKYFLNLEKAHQTANTINQLRNEDGDIITDQSDLLKECCKFYSNLYTSQCIKGEDIDEYLSEIETTSLDECDKILCEKEISEHEVLSAVKNLKNGKSPGIDGIIPEFYKEFWNVIKPLFMNMIKYVYECEELSSSQKKAVVTLIHKKGDRDILSNYRPISLTNYDYKIIAFVLATRIQKVVRKLIHEDQSGYIKGRFIGHNARLIRDIFDYCENHNVSGAIVNLDFEKAYDRLEWNFLFKVLKKFNFGDNFIKWVKILYNKPQIIIKNNGWLSKSLDVSRGIRQGCPVSSLLFVIAIEIMAVVIRTDDKIEGFQFNEEIHKLSQYADDSTLLLKTDVSLMFALHCINNFCKHSGMKLNMNKTEGIWLGGYKSNPEFFEGINFTCNPVRCLGIYIGHDSEGCHRENWMSKINKLKNCLHIWKSRKLTIYGKIMIVKTLAISKLIYSFSVLNVPEEVIKVVNRSIYEFIWNKVDRIKRNTMINELENGGLNMLDLESKIISLKAAWIPRFMYSKRHASILFMYLRKEGLSLSMLLNGNITKKSLFVRQFLPDFYSDCILSFNMCKQSKEIDEMNLHDFSTQPIWCNKLFTHKGKCLMYKHWIDSGIIYVKDLYKDDGNFLSENDVVSKLLVKANWMVEYLIVKKTVHKLQHYDMILCKYENIHEERKISTIVMNNNLYTVKGLRSRFFYQCLRKRKSVRSFMEKHWSKIFDLRTANSGWKEIYMNGVHSLPCTKLKEFAYKMVHGLLVSREILNKWKRVDSVICPFCKETENIKHIYYDCRRIQSMWQKIGVALNIDIKWRHIVLGFTLDIVTHKVRNILFKIILYAIFKIWTQSIENDVSYKIDKVIWYQVLKDVSIWHNMVYVSEFSSQCPNFRGTWNKAYVKILSLDI